MLEIKGLDQLQKKLKAFQENAQKLDGQHHVPVTDLLTPAFMTRHTQFATADGLFETSGYKIESEKDLAAIPDDAWDEYIRSISNFSGWQEMISTASQIWVVQKLGFKG